MANSLATGSKVRGGKAAAMQNKRPAPLTVRDRAQCNPKPSWKGQKPMTKKVK